MNEKQANSGTDIMVFIVEDHPIFRRGLSQVISSEEGFCVCGEAEDYLNGLDSIKKLKPDIIIVDINLRNSSGIDLIKDIKLFCPDIKILALSMHDENIYAERVLRAGAKGYLMKQEAPETILKAIRLIMEGKIYLSENMSSRMLRKLIDGQSNLETAPVDFLTDRELEIFKMIGHGFSTREISQKLHVSVKTIENHRAHIKEKLDLNNSIELIQQATLWVQGNRL